MVWSLAVGDKNGDDDKDGDGEISSLWFLPSCPLALLPSCPHFCPVILPSFLPSDFATFRSLIVVGWGFGVLPIFFR